MAECLWHAIEYQGGTCPRCWQEKQQQRLLAEHERISEEENRQRAEQEEERERREEERAEELASRIEASNLEHEIQMDMRLRTAAAEQKRNIAEAPRLQSRAMSERADELYRVGLYEDAFQTSLKAIELDRGNIKAAQIAAWTLMKQGRETEARVYFEKQLALLSTSEYVNSLDWFMSVYSGLLPNDDALLRCFSRALRKNSNLSLGGPVFDLIDTLIDRKQLNDARHLTEILLGKPVLDLIDTLIDRKYLNEAEHLTENLIRAGDSLMLEAYLLEISTRVGKSSTEKLSTFLQRIPSNKRSDLLGSFQTIVSRQGRLSDSTVGQIKLAIRERYNRWKPEIENEISEAASLQAKSAKSGEGIGWGCLTAVACCIVLWFALYVMSGGSRSANVMGTFAATPFVSILIAILTGFLIGRVRKTAYARKRTVGLEQQENQAWVSICSAAISAYKPSLFSIIEVMVLSAIGLIFIGFVSYFPIKVKSPETSVDAQQQVQQSSQERCAQDGQVFQIDDKHREKINLCGYTWFDMRNNVPALFRNPYVRGGRWIKAKAFPDAPPDVGSIVFDNPHKNVWEVQAVKGTGTVTVYLTPR